VVAAGELAEVFTEQNLSTCFGIQLSVENRHSRWTARAVI
jgi:ABC-type cobalamin/Fe3+-siderophores transport system ATPase subunit